MEFPSIIHGWIFAVLAARTFPSTIQHFVKQLYSFNAAYGCCNGTLVFLFWILSGVLQGCPLSSILFNISLDPFLECFHEFFVQSATSTTTSMPVSFTLRACADDIGVALRKLSDLIALASVFSAAELTAGLRLKPPKCVLVIISQPFAADLVCSVKKWLAENIPSWSNFKIASDAKYLGFQLGPTAGSSQWNDALCKYTRRAYAIGDAHPAVKVASHLYNMQATPVLMYLAQLAFLPKGFEAKVRSAMQAVLHVATNALDHANYFNLVSLGGPLLVSISTAARSAMIRFAIKSPHAWTNWKLVLQTAALEHLTARDYVLGNTSPCFWDSPAFAMNLASAFNGFSGDPSWSSHGRLAIDAALNASGRQDFLSGPVRFNFRLQGLLYGIMCKSKFPDSICSLIEKRILAITCFDPANLIGSTIAEQVGHSMPILTSLRTHEAFQIIRTWVNSWSTSHRYHETPRLKCLFGCPGKPDSQSHYVHCEKMHSIIDSLILFYRPPTVLDRIGVYMPSRDKCLAVAASFRAYHVVKLDPQLHPLRCDANIRIFVQRFPRCLL